MAPAAEIFKFWGLKLGAVKVTYHVWPRKRWLSCEWCSFMRWVTGFISFIGWRIFWWSHGSHPWVWRLTCALLPLMHLGLCPFPFILAFLKMILLVTRCIIYILAWGGYFSDKVLTMSVWSLSITLCSPLWLFRVFRALQLLTSANGRERLRRGWKQCKHANSELYPVLWRIKKFARHV